jgi:hypothetical protein
MCFEVTCKSLPCARDPQAAAFLSRSGRVNFIPAGREAGFAAYKDRFRPAASRLYWDGILASFQRPTVLISLRAMTNG